VVTVLQDVVRTADITGMKALSAPRDIQVRDRGAGSGGTVLYEGEHSRVLRLEAHGSDGGEASGTPGTLIWKELLGVRAAERMRHEVGILARLVGVPGVLSVVESPVSGRGFAMVDVGGVSLAATQGSSAGGDRRGVESESEAIDVVAFALELAGVVAGVHRAGVVHKDINPANILVCDGKPVLIDWGLATTFAEDRPEFTNLSAIAGTLAYMAPEQTGRTGRAVDQRADLYALGATFYELVTGNPPFGDSDDAMTMIHDHLARVPMAPCAVNAAVPAALSGIILRLLEKEPDRRYQSAQGLVADLARLLHALRGDTSLRDRETDFSLGESDFPMRICGPSELVGREAEVAALRMAFDAALAGDGRGVLVSGAPGVGKSALIGEFRSMVTVRGGWFVQGKFDQYSRDESADGVAQAMRALVRLLLAEPEARLAVLRARIASNVGVDGEVLAAVMPELSTLLGVAPADTTTIGSQEMRARLFPAVVGLLRAVASPERPLVMVVDDLQWAGEVPIGLIDAVLVAENLPGVLLVGAYRDGAVDGSHPLSAVMARWERLGVAATKLHLANLPPTQLGALVARMLRLDPGPAADLADTIGIRTAGNPYDTIVLVNALRREGALTTDNTGWRWDAATIRRFVGQGDVLGLLTARIDALPPEAASGLEVLACLGGEVGIDRLAVAVDMDPAATAAALAPALEDGLLVMTHDGVPAVRFRHDRVQQASYARLTPMALRATHLHVARRLAADPRQERAAAEPYLTAAQDVTDPVEGRRVAVLFQAAATDTRLINPARCERFLAAALELPTILDGATGDPLITQLLFDRHAALVSLGRLEEADEVYRGIRVRVKDDVELAVAANVQIVSLTRRARLHEAVTLATELLARLGVSPPSEEAMPADIGRGLERLHGWVAAGPQPGELQRPEPTDPQIVAATRLLAHAAPAAFFSRHPLFPWMTFQAHRLWVDHGPCAPSVISVGMLAPLVIAMSEGYAVSYEAARRILAVGETRGYEPETAQMRNMAAMFCLHWFEPMEESVRQVHQAREDLLRYGELQYVSFTYVNAIPPMLDSAPALEVPAAEIDAALRFMEGIGDEIIAAPVRCFQQLVRCLRGETDAPGILQGESFTASAFLEQVADDPMGTFVFHCCSSIAAAVFGDAGLLAVHTGAATPLLPHVPGMYLGAMAQPLRGLSLAEEAKAAGPTERPALLAELDGCRAWLTARAADAPENFGHLVRWIDAERAWAVEDFQAAVGSFDAAMAEVARRVRPWHAALITERAARFHVVHGLERSGGVLLTEARNLYHEWGASAKVDALEQEFPGLAAQHASCASSRGSVDGGRTSLRGSSRGNGSSEPVSAGHTSAVSSDSIDQLAVVRASQALSSETNIDRLRVRVVEVLGAMTGATSVRLVLWNQDAEGWFVPSPDCAGSEDGPCAEVSVEEAAALGMVCLSAFHYAERTRAPLLVADATRDDRFARDPYLRGVETCSLLVVPIFSRGEPRAMLLLENRLSRGNFTAERFDAVSLITGQLAVSLDNALLYASLERKVAERTDALAVANERLELLSRTDPLTGLANRRCMDDFLDAEWRRSMRQHDHVSVAMIDVDHFKLYNDHYGHPAGDRCLSLVADALAHTVRDSDLLARYGGEEFAVIMPSTDVAGARIVVERMRAAVAELNEPHALTERGLVTVSVGLAAMTPAPHLTVHRLIKAADEQLYIAKRNGRNQVMGATQDDPPGDL
jgi:diguanylate cyclase (GGDEF)-like protein